MNHSVNPNHPRMMEFFVDNPNFSEPTAMMLFLNIETEISYIFSINKSFSLLNLKNGNKFVIYGNGKTQNTRYVYGLTRSLNNKNMDYFADPLIRPSLFYTFNEMKFDLEDIHIDAGQVFGVLYGQENGEGIKNYEKKQKIEVIEYAFGDKKTYRKAKNQLLEDRKNLAIQLKNFSKIDNYILHNEKPLPNIDVDTL